MLLRRADVDFSICRFVKHHGMFWFSIKNILPKWFHSPMAENICMSFLFLSSMCSAFNRSIKQINVMPFTGPIYALEAIGSPNAMCLQVLYVLQKQFV